MARMTYVKCACCGVTDKPRQLSQEPLRVEVGTSVKMRCADCQYSADGTGLARLCRGCCPTGHGTHGMPREES